MKKVLMIAYYYPPLGGAGVQRTLKFAKYLPRFGWRPIILTPDKGVCSITCDRKEGDLDGVEVVRTGYFDVFGCLRKGRVSLDRELLYLKDSVDEQKPGWKRRLLSFLTRFAFNWIAFPDSRVGWYKYAVSKGLRVIEEKEVSLIYSTSSPETAHLIASFLKRKTGLPWIADLRDLWTQNHAYKRSRARLCIERKLEKKVLKNANALITVSEPWADQLRSIDRTFGGKVYTITNGFDPDDFPKVTAKAFREDEDKFVITYAGTVYTPGQNPRPLFKALNEVVEDDFIDPNKIEIRFYSSNVEKMDDFRKGYSIAESIKVLDRVPYSESIKAQMGSDVLLLLGWESPGNEGWLPAKTFEYLGVKRPILFISPYHSVVTELVRKANAGITVKNGDEIREALLEWYREFIQTGEVKYYGIESEIMKHTRENKTRQLVEVFEKVCKK